MEYFWVWPECARVNCQIFDFVGLQSTPAYYSKLERLVWILSYTVITKLYFHFHYQKLPQAIIGKHGYKGQRSILYNAGIIPGKSLSMLVPVLVSSQLEYGAHMHFFANESSGAFYYDSYIWCYLKGTLHGNFFHSCITLHTEIDKWRV